MVQHADIDHSGLTGVGGGEFPTGDSKVATAESTASGSFVDLATVGPSVTVTVGASGKVKVTVRGRSSGTTGDRYFGVVISGANTVAATTHMIHNPGNTNAINEHSSTTILTGLTPGATTFKLQYAVASGTGSFQNRELIVEPVL